MAPLEVQMLHGKLPCVELAADSIDKCCELARKSRGELLGLLKSHGGVLVRCSALTGAVEFERCIKEFVEVAQEYPGGAPRKRVMEGGVFTTTEFAPNLPIPAHCELSYMPQARPELIAFFCERGPPKGGMTPVLDMAEVLAPAVDKVFDPFLLRFAAPRMSWTALGATPKEAEAEWHRRNKESATVHWKDSWMQPFIDMPAVLQLEDMQVWSGFFPLFHWSGPAIQSMFDLLLHNRSWRQIWATMMMILSVVWPVVVVVASRIPLVQKLPWVVQSANPGPLSCRLSTGGSISIWDVARILWVYNMHMITWKWEPGQFVLLDNSRMGHARTPYDPAERSIYTAFGTRKKLPAA